MIPYQELTVDLIPHGTPPCVQVWASQYDAGRPIKINIQYNGAPYTVPAGSQAYIDVRKPSGKIVHDVVTELGATYAVVSLAEQMTAEYGQVLMEISLIGDGQDPIGTANWLMQVERSPLAAVDPSETWVVDLNQAVQDAKDARDDAQAAQRGAERAQGLAEDAQRGAAAAQESAEAAQRAAEAAQRDAAASKTAAETAQEKAEAAEGAAEDAAERAEQSAAVAGYMFFYIDEDGHLIYQHTTNTEVDFYLEDGHLYVEAIA